MRSSLPSAERSTWLRRFSTILVRPMLRSRSSERPSILRLPAIWTWTAWERYVCQLAVLVEMNWPTNGNLPLPQIYISYLNEIDFKEERWVIDQRSIDSKDILQFTELIWPSFTGLHLWKPNTISHVRAEGAGSTLRARQTDLPVKNSWGAFVNWSTSWTWILDQQSTSLSSNRKRFQKRNNREN